MSQITTKFGGLIIKGEKLPFNSFIAHHSAHIRALKYLYKVEHKLNVSWDFAVIFNSGYAVFGYDYSKRKYCFIKKTNGKVHFMLYSEYAFITDYKIRKFTAEKIVKSLFQEN